MCCAGSGPRWPEGKLIRRCGTAPPIIAPGGPRRGRRICNIDLVPLPGYSPDFMPVEALWRWLREDVTYHHCHRHRRRSQPARRRFRDPLNQDPCAVADRLWVKDQLDPDEEKLRFSK